VLPPVFGQGFAGASRFFFFEFVKVAGLELGNQANQVKDSSEEPQPQDWTRREFSEEEVEQGNDSHAPPDSEIRHVQGALGGD